MTVALIRHVRNGRKALHEAGEEAARRAVRTACRASHREIALESVAIEKDAMGKPHGLISGEFSPVAVSISHSFPFAFAVASVIPGICLGADIERIRPLSAAVIDAFLTKREAKLLARLPPHEQRVELVRCWSLKESVLKAIGIGLRMHPRRVDISQIIGARGKSHISIGIDDVMHKVRIWSSLMGNEYIATAIAIPTTSTYYGSVNLKRRSALYGNSRCSS